MRHVLCAPDYLGSRHYLDLKVSTEQGYLPYLPVSGGRSRVSTIILS